MALAEIIPLDTAGDDATAETWRDRLLQELVTVRAPKVTILEKYYDGDHPLPGPPAAMQRYATARDTWINLSRLGITNYCAPIPDAPAARLRPIGFRIGGSLDADPQAWEIWQRNHLDADIGLAFHKALVCGNSLALVWPVDKQAQITIEHPGQAIVAYEPGSRRDRAAGLKYWCEPDGSRRVVLYLPDKVYKWAGKEQGDLEAWQPDTDDTWPIANPLEVVPLVEFRANPDVRPALYGGGRGEFEGVLPIQNRINKTVFDQLVTGEFQAFRQRWAVGWEPSDINQAIQASASRLLSFADKEVEVGEFAQADFSGFLNAVDDAVKAMAAITSTPFYTLGELANPPSGDALMALQSGLVSKTEAHRDNFGETVEEVMGIGLAIEGVEGGSQAQVIWRSVAHVSWAERADAAIKMRGLVPDEALLEFLEYSPQDIARFRIMRASQDLFAPPAPVPTGIPIAGQ